jgi:hypothetical protein
VGKKIIVLQLQLTHEVLAADATTRFEENEHFKQLLKSLPADLVDA